MQVESYFSDVVRIGYEFSKVLPLDGAQECRYIARCK